MSRAAFVHQASLSLEATADAAAPGGAVTLALCGAWDHDGDCRWPHHIDCDPDRGEVRVVFVTALEEEVNIRRLIDVSLRAGVCTGPDGRTSRWSVVSSGPGVLTATEKALAERMGA